MGDITIWETVRFFFAMFGGAVAVTMGILVGDMAAEHLRLGLVRKRCERTVADAISRVTKLSADETPRVLEEPLRFMAPPDRQMN